MSTVVSIDTFTPVDANVPENLVDGDGVAYTAWELNDKGSFTIQVLDSYTAGSDIAVRLYESTPSTAKNHKWSLALTLFRPGSGNIDTDTVVAQYQCGLIADLLTLRTITITTTGQVDTTAVAAGDFIAVTLSRVAATSDEDQEAIALYTAEYVLETTAGTGTGTCLGRVGNIISDVRDLFNDEGGSTIEDDSTIIGWINRCQAEMAKSSLWRTSAYLSLVSGQREYDLLSSPDDFVALHDVKWAANGRPLSQAANRAVWNMMTTPGASGAQPFWYFVESNQLEVHPTPTSGVSSGLILDYAYLPDDLDCDNAYTPEISAANDIVYVHYCLAEAFKRDRHAEGAAEKAEMYRGLYEQTLQQMLGAETQTTSWGTCSGRLGAIIKRARFKLNQAGAASANVSDYELVEFCNEVTEDLAREGYWTERQQRYSGIASQATYNITTLESGGYTINRVLNVAWLMSDGYYYPLQALDSYADYEMLLYEGDSGTDEYPTHYYIDNQTLIVWPTPTTSSASGLQLRFSSLPSAFDCASGLVTPSIPPAHDQVFQCGVLYKAFEAANVLDKAQYWEGKYELARRKLHGDNIQRSLRVRPGR